MLVKESKKLLTAFALSSTLVLAACGGSSGGGSSSGGNNDGGGDPVTPPVEENSFSNVEGPLDVLQEPLATQVFGGLAEGAAGTPLEGTLNCASQLVVTDVLDVLDSFLVLVDPAALQNPQALFTSAGPQLQATITEFATDLPGLLASFTGEDCIGGAAAGDNPLNGTPLQPLGDALAPVLGGFGGDQPMDITSLSALVAQLSEAFSDGVDQAFAADPSGELENAPVLSDLLETLDVALVDLTGLLTAAENMDPEAAAVAVSTTLNNLLSNVLTEVVPITFIEEQSGQGPIISAQIDSAVDTLTGLIGGDFSGFTEGDFTELFQGGADQLLAALSGLGAGMDSSPLEGTPLAALQGLFEDALAGGLPSGTTGTPLDALLAPITAVTDALLAAGETGGPTGTPLDVLLGPIAEGLGGSAGAAGCPVAGTPLAATCDLIDGLLSGLSSSPGANPLAVLEGLVDSLLSGLFGGLAP